MNLPPLLDPTLKKTTQSANSALDALAAEGNANVQEAYNKVTAVFQQAKEEIAEVAHKNQERQEQERAALERERYLHEATLNGQARQFYVEMDRREEEERTKNDKAATELATMKAHVEEEIRIRQAALAKQQESQALSFFPPIADPSPRPLEHSLPHINKKDQQHSPLPHLSVPSSIPPVCVLPQLQPLPKLPTLSLSSNSSLQHTPPVRLPTLPSLPKLPKLPTFFPKQQD